MNTYRYNEINIGLQESFEVEINEDKMRAFHAITGDINLLHNDEQFAREMGHQGKVVYGMLTASMLSTLAGVYLPGKYSLIHQVEVKFVKPVYVGDKLIVTGRIEEINDTFEQIVMKVVITNQSLEKVLRGTMRVGFLHEKR